MQVRLCLLEFHGLPEQKADKTIAKFVRDFPLNSEEPEVEFLYHSSPFSLACEITGENLSLKERSTRYKAILESTQSNVLIKGIPSREVPNSLVEAFQTAFSVGGSNIGKRELKTQPPASQKMGNVIRERVSGYVGRKASPSESLKTTAAKSKPKTKQKGEIPKKAT